MSTSAVPPYSNVQAAEIQKAADAAQQIAEDAIRKAQEAEKLQRELIAEQRRQMEQTNQRR